MLGILLFIIISGYRKWWVWGWLYQSSEREKEEWKRLALQGTNLAEEALRKVTG